MMSDDDSEVAHSFGDSVSCFFFFFGAQCLTVPLSAGHKQEHGASCGCDACTSQGKGQRRECEERLFHPGIGPYLKTFVPQRVIDRSWIAIECDMEAISAKNQDYAALSLRKYRDWIESRCILPMPVIDLAVLKDGGYYAGQRPLEFWQAVASSREMGQNEFGGSFLLPVASMVLALPAGESVDEFTFSSSQRTLTKDRNSLSAAHIEQITVIRMFIRNLGWSPSQLGDWIETAHKEFEKRKAEDKIRH